MKAQLAAGNRRGDGKGAGLDPVGNHRMRRIPEAIDPFDQNRIGAMPADLRAHGDQAFGKIADFRFAGGIDDFRLALRQAGGNQRVLGGADRHHRKDHPPTGQARGRARLYIAVGKLDNGAKSLHRADMEIDRPRADGTAARQGDPRLAIARQKRPQHKNRGAHLADQIIRRVEIRRRAADRHGVTIAVNLYAMVPQQHLHRGRIDKMRDILEGQGAVRHQPGRHQRQRGVLRTADRDVACQRHTAVNSQPVHLFSPWMKV